MNRFALAFGGSVRGDSRARPRTENRFSCADDGRVLADRQGHGERLPDVPRRAERQLRRRQGDLHRRGRGRQAAGERAQGRKARAPGQRAPAGRRAARLDRLRDRAGEHAPEDRVHPLGAGGGRPHAARPEGLSVHRAHRLDQLAAAPSARQVGLRQQVQARGRDRRRLRLRPRGGGRLPEGVRGLRRADRAEDLAAARHQGLRPLHSRPSSRTPTRSSRSWSARWRCSSRSSCRRRA